MSSSPLQTIMNPRSVVVAGASNNFMKMGSLQALNLINGGFGGEIYFLHPTEKKILGRDAYAAPENLPAVPDLAMLVTPVKVTVKLLEQLGKIGVKHAIIVTAGFREVGEEGAQLESELVRIAEQYGIRFVGPNCIGILNAGIGLNLTVLAYNDRPGGLSLISQSGTYVAQLMPYLRERGIRYSQAISVGNSTNIDQVDCLEYLGDDPSTRAIIMYIEEIKRGREFIETARKVAAKKPIVVLYVGGTATGARSCLSHTGSLGTPDVLMNGIFAQAGVIRASTVDELFGWGHALANMPVPKGNRVAILTHSGGPATSMADTCEREGLQLPAFSQELQDEIAPMIEATASAKNPVDLTFSMDYESFVVKIPRILFNSDEVDSVLFHGLMDTGFSNEMYDHIKDRLQIEKEEFLKVSSFNLQPLLELVKKSDKPLISSNFLSNDHAAQTFRDNDLPLYRYPEAAVRALAALVRYGKIKERMNQGAAWASSVCSTGTCPTGPRIEKQGVLDEFESAILLNGYQIPIAEQQKVDSLDRALEAAAAIGYPVVLKGLPEGEAHKSESGLVHLDIDCDDKLRSAYNAIEKAAPGCPRLVAQKLHGQRELTVGMTRFEKYGPCVMFGIGGIFTEAYADVVFRAAPVSRIEALAMIDSLRNVKLLGELRGLPEVDREVLASIIGSVGELALDHPEIEEIDINPLIIVGNQPIAADALIVTKK
jgi:acetate---CoA ligase (ADP-forming)